MRRVPPALLATLLLLVVPGQAGCIIFMDEDDDPEGEAWAEFRRYLRPRQACVQDAECVVVPVDYPLGCSYGVNIRHRDAVARKSKELSEDFMGGPTCSGPAPPGCQLICREGRCLSPFEHGCRDETTDGGR
jgi:hypothetical protein